MKKIVLILLTLNAASNAHGMFLSNLYNAKQKFCLYSKEDPKAVQAFTAIAARPIINSSLSNPDVSKFANSLSEDFKKRGLSYTDNKQFNVDPPKWNYATSLSFFFGYFSTAKNTSKVTSYAVNNNTHHYLLKEEEYIVFYPYRIAAAGVATLAAGAATYYWLKNR